MPSYVILDDNNKVIGTANTAEQIVSPQYLEIENPHLYLGMKYEHGEFFEIPKTQEEIKAEKLAILKTMYITAIQEAQILGETEEVTRLQQEYQQKKAEIESQYTS